MQKYFVYMFMDIYSYFIICNVNLYTKCANSKQNGRALLHYLHTRYSKFEFKLHLLYHDKSIRAESKGNVIKYVILNIKRKHTEVKYIIEAKRTKSNAFENSDTN